MSSLELDALTWILLEYGLRNFADETDRILLVLLLIAAAFNNLWKDYHCELQLDNGFYLVCLSLQLERVFRFLLYYVDRFMLMLSGPLLAPFSLFSELAVFIQICDSNSVAVGPNCRIGYIFFYLQRVSLRTPIRCHVPLLTRPSCACTASRAPMQLSASDCGNPAVIV